jgi:hypothetical protein
MFAVARFDGRGASLASGKIQSEVAFLYSRPLFPGHAVTTTLSVKALTAGGGAHQQGKVSSLHEWPLWLDDFSLVRTGLVSFEGESSGGTATSRYTRWRGKYW